MGLMMKILVIVGLIRMLIETGKPALCAGIYALLAAIMGLVLGYGFTHVAIVVLIQFAVAFVYFWLLAKLEGAGVLWWVVLIIGLPFAFI